MNALHLTHLSDAAFLMMYADNNDFRWGAIAQNWISEYYAVRSHPSPMHEALAYRAWDLLEAVEPTQGDYWRVRCDGWRINFAQTLPEGDAAVEKMGRYLHAADWTYLRMSPEPYERVRLLINTARA